MLILKSILSAKCNSDQLNIPRTDLIMAFLYHATLHVVCGDNSDDGGVVEPANIGALESRAMSINSKTKLGLRQINKPFLQF